MTKKEFAKLGQALKHELPIFTVHGSVMFIMPVNKLLRGLSFEGSSFNKTSVYVNRFVMPLCIPHEYNTQLW